VHVAKVVQSDVTSGHAFVGTVMPTRVAVIGSAVDGRVTHFYVNEGDRVKADQPLAQLLTNTLEIQLAGAKAELELRRQELAELENGTRPEEVNQAKAHLEEMKALKAYTEAKLERAKRLVKSRSGTEDELEDAISAHQQAEQKFRNAEAAHEMAVNGPRQERIAQARAKVQVQQAVVEGIEDRIRKHTIRSPFDGYVTAEHTEVGQWVSSGEELDTVDIRVSVLEDYIDKLHVGASARVEVGALPDEAFTGEVVLIVPNADLRSRSFPVKIRVKNKMENGIVLLKSGMFASVTLPVGSSEKSLLVPKDSLVLGGPSPVVYVVDTQSESATTGTVRPTPVELGVAHQGLIQVKGALQAGQWVVTVGNERLRPGQPVQFQPPAETQVEETPKTAMR
jgi:HlyD family secretion protein